MSEQKDQIISAILVKKDGKLIYRNAVDQDFYKMFVDNLQEGQQVQIFLEAMTDTGTLTQIAKAKVCIRLIAKETGHSFNEIQDVIKHKSGLDGKSFADCSREDMSLAIQAIIELGDTIGINCR